MVVLDMKSDSLIFVPGQCSHFGAPKVPEPQKSELLEKPHVINSSIETVPILKVIKILRRLPNLDKLNRTEEMRPQESTNRGDDELTPSRGVSCQYLLGLVHLIEKPR